MFVMTLNKGGLKKLAAVGVCALALAAGALGLRMLDKGGEAVDTAAVPTSALNQKINGAEDVKAFLAGYGLEVDPTTAEVTAVKVPRKWDDSFKAFHEVIQKSGLDLKKCKGKEVDKWVVPIPAQSNETVKTYAVVLVYKNEPKGAYLLEKPSGEVKPLTPAQSTSAVSYTHLRRRWKAAAARRCPWKKSRCPIRWPIGTRTPPASARRRCPRSPPRSARRSRYTNSCFFPEYRFP